MGNHTAFFYGTLMAREILHRVCYGESQVGRDPIKTMLAANLSIRPAVLRDFCRHKVRGADYPGIIKQEGHTVRGTYVTGLTDGDLFRLDRFEGYEYRREKVEVLVLNGDGNIGDKGQTVKTETYVYTYGDENLEKQEWDYEEFRRDKLRNWTNGSHEYDEVDEAVASLDETQEGPGLGGEYVVVGKGDDEVLHNALLE